MLRLKAKYFIATKEADKAEAMLQAELTEGMKREILQRASSVFGDSYLECGVKLWFLQIDLFLLSGSVLLGFSVVLRLLTGEWS
jgi:hypothetical protein